MKKLSVLFSVILLFSFIGAAQELTWPRQLSHEGSVITLYQPQVQSWENFKQLDFRIAFSMVPYQKKEVVGVLYMNAATEVNMDNHRVLISNMKITDVHFPSLDDENSEKMEQVARSFVSPDMTQVMSVEQVVACTPKEDTVNSISVNNEPPVIFVSKVPTILLQMEGHVVKAGTGQENLEFVVNSNYPLFYDIANKIYYLYDGMEWQKSIEPSGPWTFTSSVSKSLVALGKDTTWKNLKGAIPAATKPNKKMPKIFYSEKIAELILFEGEPVYKTIDSTSLKFATNTYSDIFLCNEDKRYYFLTAGRWFSSNSLDGPWVFATPNLPSDFKKIPNDNPASSVLVFVPGTEQAKDAVMIAQIPVTIEVNATEAAKQVNIVYSGDPKFEPIENTTLYYAVNTTEKVIKVSSNQYYACYQGIWFVSTTPTGTWAVATSVPESIYNMPSSSPVYNVTYVTQTVSTTNVVYATYTSGYTGVYVVGTSSGVIIVSGTGYYHPPYYYYPPYGYPVYYPYPVTYGCYAYHPYSYGGVAYHASYNPNTGMYSRGATAYGAYGTASVAQGYNPSTGTYARGASVSTPYGKSSAAQAYNPYTGTSATTRQNSNANAQWGSSTVSKGGQSASAAHVTTSQGTTGAVKTKSGDMYATSNGNVYKNTGNGWEDASSSSPKNTSNNGTSQPKSTNSSANQTGNTGSATQGKEGSPTKQGTSQQQPSSSKGSADSHNFNSQEMNKEAQNRERGNTQTQQYSGKTSGATGGTSGTRSGGTRPSGGRSGGGRR